MKASCRGGINAHTHAQTDIWFAGERTPNSKLLFETGLKPAYLHAWKPACRQQKRFLMPSSVLLLPRTRPLSGFVLFLASLIASMANAGLMATSSDAVAYESASSSGMESSEGADEEPTVLNCFQPITMNGLAGSQLDHPTSVVAILNRCSVLSDQEVRRTAFHGHLPLPDQIPKDVLKVPIEVLKLISNRNLSSTI